MQLPFPLELLVGLVRLRAEMLSELRLLSSKEALLAVDTKDVVALVGSVLQGDIGLVIELLKPLGSLGQRRRHLELVGGEHLPRTRAKRLQATNVRTLASRYLFLFTF